MFDSHPKVFDCVCKIVPTKKHEKPVTTHQGEYEPPCMFLFAFAGSQELHDIKIQQVRAAKAQARNNTWVWAGIPCFELGFSSPFDLHYKHHKLRDLTFAIGTQ